MCTAAMVFMIRLVEILRGALAAADAGSQCHIWREQSQSARGTCERAQRVVELESHDLFYSKIGLQLIYLRLYQAVTSLH